MFSKFPVTRLRAFFFPPPIDGPSQARRVAFDSLRGVLALLLVLLHMGQQRIAVIPQNFTHQRQLSVGIFFTISGFFVAYSLLKKPEFDRPGFIRSRCRRILPAYFACLLVSIGMVSADVIIGDPPGEALGNLLSHLTLTHAWFDGHSGTILPPLWTLSHEWAFYGFILATAGMLRGPRWWWPLVAIMITAPLCRLGVYREWIDLPNDLRHPLCIMDFFAPGIAAGVLCQREGTRRLWEQARFQGILLVVGLGLAGWAIFAHHSVSFALPNGDLPGLKFYFAFEKEFLSSQTNLLFYQTALATGSACLILWLWHRPATIARLCRRTPLPWMGKVSYSTYLWHMPIIYCYARAMKRSPSEFFAASPWPLFLTVLGLIYLHSAFAWRLFEKPFLNPKS
ncbi:MAG: acyltransferase family protein [Verrucomicrobiales bacterium]